MNRVSVTSLIFAGAIALSPAASAQQSESTLRIAINDMFGQIDPYHFPHDEAGSFYRTIYQGLIAFDEYEGEFVPELAKSWKRISPTQLEFDLRDDVKFHNGNPFDADDVLATVGYVSDPKTRIRFKDRYNWASAEKLGPYKVRITANQPFSTDLSAIAYRFKMLDGETMKALDQVSDYGRVSPVATGIYKVVSFDTTKGIEVERYDAFRGDGRAPVRRVVGIPIPDRQTQIAELMTGGVDLLRNVTADMARQLKLDNAFTITPTPSGNLLYVTLDAVGRSGSALMTDERVRKAFIMAIPREEIVRRFVPGGEKAELPKSICFESTIACEPTTQPYRYDLAQAKKLLAEAGYPQGVDMTMYAFAPIQQIAEAIAGEVRKAGFRARVEPLPLSVYVKKRGDGEFTAFTGYYPTSAQPDTSNLLDFFFGANRDYWRDPLIRKAAEAGEHEFDVRKRTALYVPSLDRVNTAAYIFPVSELPLVFAHRTNVKVMRNQLSATESRLGDYAWSSYHEASR